ncbi:uncharacterized protein DUF4184 [Chitinophaga dinghuensis]|uniref:Uncharacterized protein DUF4184 n=1 Tax=Chitinophaga dinghuensis TaxID=1539050 RepID=A0A327VTM2_9BACT|nr:DUF4184 family protein [Chitinophaga dinghuensis]RAJ77410.1 uncharacterized protein DUF4184 [Chitinophaga dinghuensis]
MPFTISHIAAVLPFRHVRKLSFTALIIGSMAPDFEYILRMTLYGHYGHTLTGVVLFDVPVSIAVYLLYQWGIRQSLFMHLPRVLYIRCYGFIHADWKTYLSTYPLWFLLSIIMGIFTHLLWDGLTHGSNYDFANYLTFLLIRIPVGRYHIPVHSILQGVSSIGGLIILVWYVWRMPVLTETAANEGDVHLFWILVVVLALLMFIVRLLIGIPNEKLIGQLIVIGMSAAGFSVAIVSIVYKVFKIN